ncbi:hypothetical protein HDU80_004684 [Chytriomyces hyalinus]|nr:hypothetical protein HDU80_004684 [Chytriomyces hyalinus]
MSSAITFKRTVHIPGNHALPPGISNQVAWELSYARSSSHEPAESSLHMESTPALIQTLQEQRETEREYQTLREWDRMNGGASAVNAAAAQLFEAGVSPDALSVTTAQAVAAARVGGANIGEERQTDSIAGMGGGYVSPHVIQMHMLSRMYAATGAAAWGAGRRGRVRVPVGGWESGVPFGMGVQTIPSKEDVEQSVPRFPDIRGPLVGVAGASLNAEIQKVAADLEKRGRRVRGLDSTHKPDPGATTIGGPGDNEIGRLEYCESYIENHIARKDPSTTYSSIGHSVESIAPALTTESDDSGAKFPFATPEDEGSSEWMEWAARLIESKNSKAMEDQSLLSSKVQLPSVSSVSNATSAAALSSALSSTSRQKLVSTTGIPSAQIDTHRPKTASRPKTAALSTRPKSAARPVVLIPVPAQPSLPTASNTTLPFASPLSNQLPKEQSSLTYKHPSSAKPKPQPPIPPQHQNKIPYAANTSAPSKNPPPGPPGSADSIVVSDPSHLPLPYYKNRRFHSNPIHPDYLVSFDVPEDAAAQQPRGASIHPHPPQTYHRESVYMTEYGQRLMVPARYVAALNAAARVNGRPLVRAAPDTGKNGDPVDVGDVCGVGYALDGGGVSGSYIRRRPPASNARSDRVGVASLLCHPAAAAGSISHHGLPMPVKGSPAILGPLLGSSKVLTATEWQGFQSLNLGASAAVPRGLGGVESGLRQVGPSAEIYHGIAPVLTAEAVSNHWNALLTLPGPVGRRGWNHVGRDHLANFHQGVSPVTNYSYR